MGAWDPWRFLSGHAQGCVVLWGVAGGVASALCAVRPAGCGRLVGLSALPAAHLLLTAHEDGHVALSPLPCQPMLRSSRMEGAKPGTPSPGWDAGGGAGGKEGACVPQWRVHCWRMRAHRSAVTALALTPSRLVTGSRAGSIKVGGGVGVASFGFDLL